MNRSFLPTVTVVAALMMMQGPASAGPRSLDCKLTTVQTKTGSSFEVASENQRLTITFDEGAKTLIADLDARLLAFDHVTITPITMTGYVLDVSLGIDRSDWSIVLQTYEDRSIRSEFGTCLPASGPSR